MNITAKVKKNTLNSLKDKFQGEYHCLKMYDLHKNKFPINHKILARMSEEELSEILHACCAWMNDNKAYFTEAKETVDKGDLAALLRSSLDSAFNIYTKELRRNGVGLGFLNSFVKSKLLSVTVFSKSKKTIHTRIHDFAYLYKV